MRNALGPFRVFRRSLRRRIILLVGFGMVALAGFLGASTLGESRELSARALDERLRLAQALAEHLDYVLKSNLVILQEVALNARTGLGENDLGSVKGALRDAYLRSMFTEGVFLLDRTGQLVWMEPEQLAHAGEDFSSVPCVREVLEAGKPNVSDLTTRPQKRIYAVVPVRNWRGDLIGVVGGQLDPGTPRFRSLLSHFTVGETTYLDVVDGHGIVLFSTREGRAFTTSDHGSVLANLIREKKSVVGACHSCHQEDGVPEREVMAFAPLRFAPWGVNIRQAESEALAAAVTMKRRLWSVGSVTILVALLFAWGVARSVTKPLSVLTDAAQRIERGDLQRPIPPLGEDEIGQLAQSFDQMRKTVSASLETIVEGKRNLEERVQSRTRELEQLYKELQKKEEMRRELLKKVIAAQEEERKRIARELHDQTSQEVAALLLALETSSKTLPAGATAPLRRMKAMADRVLDGIHHLIFDLRPSTLDDLGLPAALRFSAENRLEPMGIDLSFEVTGVERRLEPEIETTLFRIAQEAISNITRHSEAESVRIAVEFATQRLRLTIEDDGKGFDPGGFGNSINGARGLGLLGMKERAALLGGTVTVRSELGAGTQITVEVPVKSG